MVQKLKGLDEEQAKGRESGFGRQCIDLTSSK
jgi:hypothetical protein